MRAHPLRHSSRWAGAAGAILAALALALTAGPAAAIRGGAPADPAAWPFIVALMRPGANDYENQFCAGALVAPNRVVTAAHCVVEDGRVLRARDVQVRTGGQPLARRRGDRVRVAAIRKMPRYRDTGEGWDAAVLVLAEPVSTPTIRVATGADAAITAATRPAQIAGWGDRTDGNGVFPTRLFAGTVPIRSARLCGRLVSNLFEASSDMCAGVLARGGPDTCKGDSGGPLIVVGTAGEPVLAGITSSGNGCGRPRSPGVYTRVAALTGWLRSVGVPVDPPAPAPPPPPAPAPAPPVPA